MMSTSADPSVRPQQPPALPAATLLHAIDYETQTCKCPSCQLGSYMGKCTARSTAPPPPLCRSCQARASSRGSSTASVVGCTTHCTGHPRRRRSDCRCARCTRPSGGVCTGARASSHTPMVARRRTLRCRLHSKLPLRSSWRNAPCTTMTSIVATCAGMRISQKDAQQK